jgi:hypothetical protein
MPLSAAINALAAARAHRSSVVPLDGIKRRRIA